MAISTKPVRNKPRAEKNVPDVDEKEIAAIINKGGRSAAFEDSDALDVLKRVQLRLYTSQLAEIDTAIARLKNSRHRFPNFSRHQFLIEAISEKLEREL
ncbi:MAG: hypothetical protein O7E52_25900 [Candidatus Poribacteria bacterium]|nr:hypothetical protein [Candidatus Poribacteria bacterium]